MIGALQRKVEKMSTRGSRRIKSASKLKDSQTILLWLKYVSRRVNARKKVGEIDRRSQK